MFVVDSIGPVSSVPGRGEVLRSGQAQWVPAPVGTRLAEGYQVRALAGGVADLTLPDGSRILVAENTRFAVTKLEHDPQSGLRNAAFHLVAGKLWGRVTRVAVQLVRARQSNFAISTPTGVAAVRGTEPVVFFNPATQQAVVFILPSAGEDPTAARATWVNFATGQQTTVTGNNFITQIGSNPPSAPTPISNLSPGAQAQIRGAVNASTGNSPQLTAPTVVIVSQAQIEAILQTLGIQPTAGPPPGPPPPPPATGTLGRDVVGGCTGVLVCPSAPCPPNPQVCQ